MQEKEILYLSQIDVVNVDVQMSETLELMETCHREKGLGYTIMPPKPGLMVNPPADTANTMPAYFKRLGAFGMKFVGGYEDNYKVGLPHICSTIILNDPKTGYPICIMDGNWVSANRTGGTSGLSCKYLANPDSEVVSIIGCGFQGRTNLNGILKSVPNLNTVFCYDVIETAIDRYIEEMSDHFPNHNFIKVDNPKSAVIEADILATCAPGIKEYYALDGGVVERGWLKKGCTIAAVDVMQYLYQDVLNTEIDLFTTDDMDQYFTLFSRVMRKQLPFDPVEMSQIILGKAKGRENHDDIIYCCNIGLGLSDVILADAVYKQALKKGLGTIIKR